MSTNKKTSSSSLSLDLKVEKKYTTTIIIETDYYPEELNEGYVSFFINLPTNNQARVLKKEIKKNGGLI